MVSQFARHHFRNAVYITLAEESVSKLLELYFFLLILSNFIASQLDQLLREQLLIIRSFKVNDCGNICSDILQVDILLQVVQDVYDLKYWSDKARHLHW